MLPSLSDLEKSGQLPVQEVLRGTDDFVLWIFTISPLFMFSRSRNPFDIPTVLPCLCDLKNPVQLPVNEVLMIMSYTFLKFLHYSCF